MMTDSGSILLLLVLSVPPLLEPAWSFVDLVRPTIFEYPLLETSSHKREHTSNVCKMRHKKKRVKKEPNVTGETVPEEPVSSNQDVAASSVTIPAVLPNEDHVTGMAKIIMVDLQSSDETVLVAAMGQLAEEAQESDDKVIEGISLGAHMSALLTMKRKPDNEDIQIDGCTVIQMLAFMSSTSATARLQAGNTIREALARAGCFGIIGRALQRFPDSRMVQLAGLSCLVNLLYGGGPVIDDRNRRAVEGGDDPPADVRARWKTFAHDHANTVVNAMERHEDDEVQGQGVRVIWNLTLYCGPDIWENQVRVPAIINTARDNFPAHYQIQHFSELFTSFVARAGP